MVRPLCVEYPGAYYHIRNKTCFSILNSYLVIFFFKSKLIRKKVKFPHPCLRVDFTSTYPQSLLSFIPFLLDFPISYDKL